jgi:hypothetical protein
MLPLDVIQAYFDALDRKIEFVASLDGQGRHDEALLLCCAYIDALGTHYHGGTERSKKAFVRVINDHGGAEAQPLRLIHPSALLRALPGCGAATIAKAIEPRLSAERELLAPSRLLGEVSSLLTAEQLSDLADLLWLGSLAAIAYSEMRCAFVHRGGGPKFVSFDLSHVEGEPAPELCFDLLYAVLRNVAHSARATSVSTGTWFGRC